MTQKELYEKARTDIAKKYRNELQELRIRNTSLASEVDKLKQQLVSERNRTEATKLPEINPLIREVLTVFGSGPRKETSDELSHPNNSDNDATAHCIAHMCEPPKNIA